MKRDALAYSAPRSNNRGTGADAELYRTESACSSIRRNPGLQHHWSVKIALASICDLFAIPLRGNWHARVPRLFKQVTGADQQTTHRIRLAWGRFLSRSTPKSRSAV